MKESTACVFDLLEKVEDLLDRDLLKKARPEVLYWRTATGTEFRAPAAW
jgi:hypothetical protein